MLYDPPLQPAELIKRYKRFLADVRLPSGEMTTIHCPNPGAMTGFKDEGLKIWIQPAAPGRKLPYKWELADTKDGLVGINTMRPNQIVAEALVQGRIPELADYRHWRAEVKYQEKSRIDFLLSDDNLPDCYLEIKNVHLRRDNLPKGQGIAEFPDSVTQRGVKHLHALMAMKEQGYRSILLYVVQRMDCQSVSVAADIDPAYAKALAEAQQAGIEILAYQCHITEKQLQLGTKLSYQSA